MDQLSHERQLMKTSKTQKIKHFSNPFGTKRKVVGKGRLLPNFLPEVRK
jgi:hypothetical protein